MQVVGLSGKIGTGKTQVANLLVSSFPVGYALRVAFGDLLKQEVAEVFGFDKRLCYDQRAKNEFIVPTLGFPACPATSMVLRELLQWYGTEYRRKQDPRYWVKAMDTRIAEIRVLGVAVLVVDDVRFPDEAELILKQPGAVYRLQPYLGWKPGSHANHSSETALDNFTRFTAWLHPEYGQLDSVAFRIRSALSLGYIENGGFVG